eukprot:7784749-Pyramimonas_sp.AAC.2
MVGCEKEGADEDAGAGVMIVNQVVRVWRGWEAAGTGQCNLLLKHVQGSKPPLLAHERAKRTVEQTLRQAAGSLPKVVKSGNDCHAASAVRIM